MRFLTPFYHQTRDMILRTLVDKSGTISRVVYELPRHEAVNKYTKMTLVEKRGFWYVVADTYSSEGKIAGALAEDEDRVIDIREVDSPVARDRATSGDSTARGA